MGSKLTTTNRKELMKDYKQLKCQVFSIDKPTYWPMDPRKIADYSLRLLTISENILEKKIVNRSTEWDNLS